MISHGEGSTTEGETTIDMVEMTDGVRMIDGKGVVDDEITMIMRARDPSTAHATVAVPWTDISGTTTGEGDQSTTETALPKSNLAKTANAAAETTITTEFGDAPEVEIEITIHEDEIWNQSLLQADETPEYL